MPSASQKTEAHNILISPRSSSFVMSIGYNCTVQVVSDFDFTLSKFTENGERCSGCHNVLEEGGVLPEDFKVKARGLRDHYFPIETNPQLSIEEKIPIMVEWWTQAHALLSSYPLTKTGISEMVQNSTAKLRDGCPWLFDQLDAKNIPLLIFSAGVGDVIEEVIRQQSQFHKNMRVVSNYIDFDEEGKMIGFKGDLIHVYNKNESSIHDSDYFKNLSHRHNVILIGDSLGDLHMADGATGVKNKLKIGFLNVKVEESLELYKKKFDIVIVQDETLDVVNALMRSILQTE
ncbi:hypothetical protein FSP39_004237 [Pinctada imbricata]|uniref:5'-nucleotidase n=1 Tax=Pinctada imbricata TaxID=66713 RepID=A0AA88XCG5_PINIB|nr:hypothetical protein FSP39_004237 [Pinctada imbricata]